MMKTPGIFSRIRREINARLGRNTLVFLVFMGIATLFWCLMSLNDDVQREYELPVVISDLPADMTLLTGDGALPTVIVSVKDKGLNQLSKRISNDGHLTLSYYDFNNIHASHRLVYNQSQMGSALRQYFGTSATISTFAPDSLSISYTTLPPIKIPVNIKARFTPKNQYIVNGAIKTNADSVLLYYAPGIDPSLVTVSTESIVIKDLTDTTNVTVKLIAPAGCRTLPESLTITVPVEPLVTKRFTIPVDGINIPAGKSLVTFPAAVEFSALVPMSQYNAEPYPVKAYADFDKRDGNYIPLDLSLLPDYYKNGSISPSQVEFLIEDQTSQK